MMTARASEISFLGASRWLGLSALLLGVLACSGEPTPDRTEPTGGGAPGSAGSPPASGAVAASSSSEPPMLGEGGEAEAVGPTGGQGGASSLGASGEGQAAGSGPSSPGATAPGPCCEAGRAKGCLDAAVEQCVCAKDPRCCTEEWNEVCVALVAGVSGADCGSCETECCTEGSGPGCTDDKVEQCVCAIDDTCCRERWDASCVLLVSKELSGATCGACR